LKRSTVLAAAIVSGTRMTGFARTDVIVIGGGPAGLAAAIACQDAGLSAVVADTSRAASTAAARGRSAALFNKTVAFLQRLGVWQACQDAAEPLKTLQFIDDTGRILRAPDCAFHAAEIGESAFGYNIANADLARALAVEAARRGIAVISPGKLAELDIGSAEATAVFDGGTMLAAPLVIGADGRNSAVREAAGIRSFAWAYSQTALAGSFSHERPHNSVCIEFHRQTGPLTLIPLPGNRCSYVWSERKAQAERLLGLSDADFAAEAGKATHFALGRIFDPGERAAFPLSTVLVREYGRPRVALAGEAAHAVPPIGAQGLNLGFRDVETLAALLSEAKRQGEDIGSDGLLRAYSASRRGDILSRTLGLDLLNRSLLTGFLPAQAARGLGLYALGAVGPLRRAFMRRGIAPEDFL
jgi:2-octaprenyl-6-methoxyphenol hydroxylase